MKKALLLFALLFLALLTLFACNLTPEGGDEDGMSSSETTAPPPPVGNFEIVAAQRVLYANEETRTIAISVVGEDATADATVTYQLLSGEGRVSISEDGIATFTASTGSAVVQAVIDGKVSRNTISIHRILDKRDRFAQTMTERGFGALDLGSSIPFDHNLPADAFTIQVNESANGCLRFLPPTEDRNTAQLEVIGIAREATVTLLDADGDVYWSGTCSNMDTTLGRCVRASAIDCGIATADTTCISADILATMPKLSLTSITLDTIEGWHFLSYFSALTDLSLAQSSIFDLSFLAGRTQLTALSLPCITAFDLADSDALLATIDSLTGLEHLSIQGSVGVLGGDLCSALISRVKAGSFALAVMDDLTLTSESPDGFLDTVFFSIADLKAHIDAHDGKLIPANGYHHAILSTIYDENNSAHASVHLDPAITSLQVYGNTRIALFPTSDLTIDLYNSYWFAIPNEGDKILSSADLTINAHYGWNCIEGSSSVWWTTDGYTWCAGHTSAVVCKDLTLYAAPGASLVFRGGAGNEGTAGKADGSNPNSSASQKHGAHGDWGKAAVDVEVLVVLGGTIEFVGGKGGPGGDGANGNNYNMPTGGYNAGNGGNGGRGGAGILCKSYTAAAGANVTITGGSGGGKGDGGSGYLLGSDGKDGTPGGGGPQIEYK